jgi:probable rRNA maturation factor
MPSTPNHHKSPVTRGLRLRLFVQNKTGRKGVPLTRSFENWVKAALATRRRGWTEVNIIIVDEVAARSFNSQFRRKNYATNILSFPYEPLPGEKTGLLGDLVICPAVVASEAAEQGKPLRHHYAHLTVHGVLHLLGHDHEAGPEAARMEALEIRILAGLDIPDPYS